jgi:hypothetical protein
MHWTSTAAAHRARTRTTQLMARWNGNEIPILTMMHGLTHAWLQANPRPAATHIARARARPPFVGLFLVTAIGSERASEQSTAANFALDAQVGAINRFAGLIVARPREVKTDVEISAARPRG